MRGREEERRGGKAGGGGGARGSGDRAVTRKKVWILLYFSTWLCPRQCENIKKKKKSGVCGGRGRVFRRCMHAP